jgi:hypothetical protein
MPKNKIASESENHENKVAGIVANKSLIAETVTIAMKKISGSQEKILDNLK